MSIHNTVLEFVLTTFGHESPDITTRPGLQPKFTTFSASLFRYLPFYAKNKFILFSNIYFTIHTTNLTDKNSIKSNKPNRKKCRCCTSVL